MRRTLEMTACLLFPIIPFLPDTGVQIPERSIVRIILAAAIGSLNALPEDHAHAGSAHLEAGAFIMQ